MARSTNINETNVTVVINNYNAQRAKLGSNLSPLPIDTDYAQVEKKYIAALTTALGSLWTGGFPGATLNTSQIAVGFLEADGPLTPGMTVPCASTLVEQSLKNWNVISHGDFTSNVITTMVTGLINSGGNVYKGTGAQPESASQTTDWAVVATPFRAGTGPTAATIVGYAFSAQTVVSL
jgi:hypothetical protein